MFKPRTPRIRDRSYLDWIKQLPCLACACEGRITYGVDPAHIRHAFGDWRPVGKAEKPDDWRSVPLCREHHDEQHDSNERAWWARLGVGPVGLCNDLRSAYPDVEDGVTAVEVHAHNARQAKRTAARLGGLSEPVEAAPEPVTVHAGRTGRIDDRGNVEVILTAAGQGRELISQRVFVTPDAIGGGGGK